MAFCGNGASRVASLRLSADFVCFLQRKEMDSVLSRNMEFSQTITNYQQRLREGSQKLHAAEELANKLKIEVISCSPVEAVRIFSV